MKINAPAALSGMDSQNAERSSPVQLIRGDHAAVSALALCAIPGSSCY